MRVAGLGAVSAVVVALTGTAYAGVVGPINTGSFTGPAQIKFTGFSTENGLTAGTNETTWGAGFVTNIFEFGNSSNSFYSNGVPGIDKIGYVLYGIADANIVGSGPFDIYNVGCTGGPCDGKIHIDFYALPNATPTNFGAADPAGLTVADRTGFSSFHGITDVVGGSLLMSWEMVPGLQTVDVAGGTDPLFDETLAELIQNVNSQTLPTTGDGSFLADCVSGPACVLFDNNAQPTPAIGADFFGQFTLRDSLTAGQSANGWQGTTEDPVTTAVVPEPISLTLLGSGLLALGFLRRRAGRD